MKSFRKIAISALATGLLAFAGTASSAQLFGQFLTGSSGGVYDIVGSAIVNVINKNVAGVRLNPSNPPSYSRTPPSVNSGAAVFGISDADQFYKAYNGKDEFKTPLKNLRIVMPLYSNVMSQITLDSSGIKTLADAKGKKVAVPSVSTKNLVAQMYEYAGVPADSIKWVYLTYAEAADALSDGNVDIATFTAFPKNGTVEGVASLKKIRFLKLDDKTIEKWNTDQPRTRIATIPAGTYPDVDVDAQYYTLYVLLTTNDKTDPAIIKNVVASVLDHKADIAATHPAGAQLSVDLLPDYVKKGIIDPKLIDKGTLDYYQSIGQPIATGN